MSKANYVQDSFLGGQWSELAQGQVTHRDYKRSMRLMSNCLPVEQGASVRRPGQKEAGRTRLGQAAKMLDFDFTQSAPYVLEFTPGICRAWLGDQIVTDMTAAVTAISADTTPEITLDANPSIVQGSSVVFSAGDPRVAINTPVLLNRHWLVASRVGTVITLADPITGQSPTVAQLANFNASEGPLLCSRIMELSTPFTDLDLPNLRKVATDDAGISNIIILSGRSWPKKITATPAGASFATFGIIDAPFQNGPFYDPIPGSIITPDATSGLVNLTLSFATYSGSTVYKQGDYVLSSGVAYRSLVDANLNHTPASNIGTWWRLATIGEGVPGSNGAGFQTSDVGRHVRLVNSTTVTWGKITSLSTTGLISPSLVGSSPIGNLTARGGIAGAFQTSAQALAASAAYMHTKGSANVTSAQNRWVGKDFGASSPQAITSIIVNPPSDYAMVKSDFGSFLSGLWTITPAPSDVTVELRASATSPGSNPIQGTVLGSANVGTDWTTSLTINSNDAVTTFRYVWVVFRYTNYDTFDICVGRLSMYTGAVSVGASVQVQIFGVALPNTNAMSAWGAGLYNDTTQTYPKCGCYADGRLWLSGAIDNRFDASVANDPFNYATASSSGVVGDGNAISATLNSSDVNPIFWMMPDLQGILVGTQGGEWILQGAGSNSGSANITPTSIIARRITKYRCANVEPVRTGLTTCFVQRFKRRLHEFLSDVFSGKFYAPDLTEMSKGMTVSGIEDVTFQSEPAPVLWARLGDNTLVGCTYRRTAMLSHEPPEYRAWHEHVHGGGHEYISLAMGGIYDGTLDALTACARDPITGLHNVQVMQPIFDEDDTLLTARHLDSYLVPVAATYDASGVTFHGLHNLNGKTVSAFVAGLDAGDHPVANGIMVVPWKSDPDSLFTQAYVVSISQQGPDATACTIFDVATGDTALATIPALIGHTYTTRAQTLPPVDPVATGARLGPAFGKVNRHNSLAMKMMLTQGVSIGTDFDRAMQPLVLKSRGGRGTQALKKNQLFSGIVWQPVDDEGTTMDNSLCWQVTRPYPCSISAVGGFDSAEDR